MRRWRSSTVASRTTPSSSRPTERPASTLDLPVERLRGVGEQQAKLLDRLGIRTIGDLIWHLPTRHHDYSALRGLGSLQAGAEQSAVAVIGRISQRRTARGQLMTEVELREEDGTPSRVRATWFGRQFIRERFREGARVRVAGKVGFFGRGLVFQQPSVEPAEAEAVHTGRLVPVYRLTEGLKEGNVRRFLHTAIVGEPGKAVPVVDEVRETLPDAVRARHGFPPVAEALRQVHFPEDTAALLLARRRLAFGDLLVLQLALGQRRARWTRDAHAPALRVDDARFDEWVSALPFALTAAQERVIGHIRGDLARTVPMSRLLEGDVGSG
ncbi:MAG: DNA helicase RecG, partial [Chloroflexi bacterium]|nr:DNA helicase RecG [Chloroflexota bacterium]